MSRRRVPLGTWVSLLLGLAGVLSVVWYTGALDGPLSSVGLNKNPCVVVVLTGAKLCGDDARAWCAARVPGTAPGLAFGEQPRSDQCDAIRP